MAYRESTIAEVALKTKQLMVKGKPFRGALAEVLRSYKDIPSHDWSEFYMRVGKAVSVNSRASRKKKYVEISVGRTRNSPENGYQPDND